MTVQANIIQIGNSRGIRLSKAVLEESRLGDTVEIEVRDRCLIIRPGRGPRVGWSEAFAAMAAQGDDQPLDITSSAGTDWDHAEWQW